jgi:hypothetical protein
VPVPNVLKKNEPAATGDGTKEFTEVTVGNVELELPHRATPIVISIFGISPGFNPLIAMPVG